MFDHEKLKECRSALKLSQEGFVIFLAMKDFHVTRATLDSWEKGRTCPTVRDFSKIAAAVGKKVSFFFLK